MSNLTIMCRRLVMNGYKVDRIQFVKLTQQTTDEFDIHSKMKGWVNSLNLDGGQYVVDCVDTAHPTDTFCLLATVETVPVTVQNRVIRWDW